MGLIRHARMKENSDNLREERGYPSIFKISPIIAKSFTETCLIAEGLQEIQVKLGSLLFEWVLQIEMLVGYQLACGAHIEKNHGASGSS